MRSKTVDARTALKDEEEEQQQQQQQQQQQSSCIKSPIHIQHSNLRIPSIFPLPLPPPPKKPPESKNLRNKPALAKIPSPKENYKHPHTRTFQPSPHSAFLAGGCCQKPKHHIFSLL